jgi:hypothetical protein
MSMELDIKELGITLVVGAFTIFSLELILRQLFGIELIVFFRSKKPRGTTAGEDPDGPATGGQKDHAMKAAVFIGLAFGVGILAEDLSYKYVDNVETPFKFVPAAIGSRLSPERKKDLNLPSKEDVRVTTLVKNLADHPKPEHLATELAMNHAFSLENPTTGDKVEKWLLNKITCERLPEIADGTSVCPSQAEVADSIKSLYYYAKNRSYAIPEYYDEMKKIQSRVDFSRSIALIAFFFFALAALLALLRTAVKLWKMHSLPQSRLLVRTIAFIPLVIYSLAITLLKVFWFVLRAVCSYVKAITLRLFAPDRYKPNNLDEARFKTLSVIVMLFVVYFLGMWAYWREAEEFNKRAFGYYSSMLTKERREMANKVAVSGMQIAPTAGQPTPSAK